MLAKNKNLEFTLVGDGPRDRALIPILQFLLREKLPQNGVTGVWADLTNINPKPQGLAERVRVSIELFRCDILFVHRDAEGEPQAARIAEIEAACEGQVGFQYVPVVPVRMTEAWLLFDEAAIRRAAGNPNGHDRLALPRVADAEHVLDPKVVLEKALADAASLSARRRRSLRSTKRSERFYRVSTLIEDFSPLRGLPSFRALDGDIDRVVANLA